MANLTKLTAALLIAGALVLGLLAWTLARRPPPPSVVVPPPSSTRSLTPVVVATRALSAGQPIPADALRVQPLPIHPQGAVSDSSLVAGRVPLADIAADAPVLDQQLSSSLATSLAPGERAVAVRVDETNAVGNALRAGNYVDVFFTLRRDGSGMNGGEIGRTQARLLISKARVLVFDAQPNAQGNATAQRTTNFGTQNAAPRTAVLAVPVTEVDRLALAQSHGQLIFALRNPADDDQVDPAAFGPQPGVLKVVSLTAPDGSTRAAAGVALDQLAGSGVPRETVPVASAAPRRADAAARGGLEVIRGGRAETLAW
ncbi:Flp pilus assembly protein CpaB [Paraburkholderia tagetis]|uniref:Flp pilus assembly protein CpaB n=1 Tax=Paraburkholderia tagetis TaxID=2913261 RepID=A0A9X1RKG6_9BURK|nr:Flp pilus assembly protein CpaB [Paraburkholderia tagetis]MCG5073936.1 Flp pilus assembly protein CpaB [Paraburkholderia tagetis]